MSPDSIAAACLKVLEFFLTYAGGFAGIVSAWTLYKDGIPRVKSEISNLLYSAGCRDQKNLTLQIYPGRRPVRITAVEVEGFDFAVLGENGVPSDTMEPVFQRGRVSVDWDVPPAADDPAPLIKTLRISRFNLNSSASISLRVRLRIQSIPFVIRHDKYQSMKP